MPFNRIFPFIIILLICAGSYGEEYRTFTGTNGRKIEARFVSFDQENQTVKIILKDGREQTVLLSLFSEQDREFIRNDEKTDNPFAENEVAPKILKIEPPNGSKNLDPAQTKTIIVTFDREMDRGFSYCRVPNRERPKATTRWTDKKTFQINVELEPDTEYGINFNETGWMNFKSIEGVPLEPVVYTFSTGSKKTIRYYRTKGKDIIGPNGKAVRWRGMNVCAFIEPTPKDAEEMKEMNVNVVRYMFGAHFYNGKFTPQGIEPMAKSKRSFVKDVELFTKENIGVIPVVGTNEPMPWHDEKKNEEFLKLWKHIIDELKHDPGVVAWDLYNEPHDVDDEVLAKWYKKIIPIIRQYDPHRPIIIEGGGWGGVGGLKESLLVRDKNIIYSFHSYYPGQYTKQKKENPVQYPTEDHDINAMAKTITPAVQFRERFNVPVICGEWGVRNLAPNQDRWIKDMATVLETYEIDWLFWAWAWKHESERTVGFGIDKTYTKKYALMSDIYKNPRKYRKTNRKK